MDIESRIEQLRGLLVDFYEVTGQKCSFYDSEFKQLAIYPRERCEFCTIVRSCGKGMDRCEFWDNYGMKEAKRTGKPLIYRCHAGMVEVCAPILEQEECLGYIMFGQLLLNDRLPEQKRRSLQACADLQVDQKKLTAALDRSIRVIAPEYLHATVNIMSACIGHIRLEQMLRVHRSDLWGEIREYIRINAARAVKLPEMAHALSVSVTTLAKCARENSGETVIGLVTGERIKRAKKLLETTDLPVFEIAMRCGMEDYNYFSRMFKRKTGKTPTGYRASAEPREDSAGA